MADASQQTTTHDSGCCRSSSSSCIASANHHEITTTPTTQTANPSGSGCCSGNINNDPSSFSSCSNFMATTTCTSAEEKSNDPKIVQNDHDNKHDQQQSVKNYHPHNEHRNNGKNDHGHKHDHHNSRTNDHDHKHDHHNIFKNDHDHKHDHHNSHTNDHDHKHDHHNTCTNDHDHKHDHHSSCKNEFDQLDHKGAHHNSCKHGHDHEHDHHNHKHGQQNSCNHYHIQTTSPTTEVSGIGVSTLHHQQKQQQLCLAMLHENGTDVVVYDVAGKAKVFRQQRSCTDVFESNPCLSKTIVSTSTDELCFSNHDLENVMDLTQCFDENGLHREIKRTNEAVNQCEKPSTTTDSLCFCGAMTPHLHAHRKDPVTCGSSSNLRHRQEVIDETKRLISGVKTTQPSGGLADVLASYSFYPTGITDHPSYGSCVTTDDNGVNNCNVDETLTISASHYMPSECNSDQVQKLLINRKNAGNSSMIRLPYTVRHDDHVDFLVHNSVTGQLHLEYPCNSCGKDDFHGVFRSVGSRQLLRSNTQLHFYAIERTKPFNVVEFIQSFINLRSSDRVNTVEHILDVATTSATPTSARLRKPFIMTTLVPRRQNHVDNTSKTNTIVIVQSTFKCTNICCSSEIPAITKILKPVPGIQKTMVNVPLKLIMVDHNPSVVTATQIADALNRQQMLTTIQRDGGGVRGTGQEVNDPTRLGRSQFAVQNICCASEIPSIKKILNRVVGVENVSVNTTTKIVYVDHDVNAVSAQIISDALTKGGFTSDIRMDAATLSALMQSNQNQQLSNNPLLVQSTISYIMLNDFDAGNATASIHSLLQTLVSVNRLDSFVVDPSSRLIVVFHNPFTTPIDSIVDQMNGMLSNDDSAIGSCTVYVDGSDPALWKFPFSSIIDDDNDGTSCNNTSSQRGNPTANVKNAELSYPRPAVMICGVLWLISMISYFVDDLEYLKYVALVSVAFGIPQIAMKAMRVLSRYQFDTNCLMLFAAIGAICLQDFPEAAAVVFLFALSEWLEVRATTRARLALEAIVQLRPETANILHPFTREVIIIHAATVPLGALITVRAGDKVPCDGTVVEGKSTVDESSLTGESRPIKKSPGDSVSGGTVNSGRSPLVVQTTSTADDSAVARLIRLVEEAQANRSDTEQLVEAFAKVYTPFVVLGAVLMCSIPWAFGPEIGSLWTQNALILMVVACPCALIISTPVAYVAGLTAAAQKGVLVKGGAHLEALSQVKHICFDKTGTLTNGEFSILHCNTLSSSLSRSEIIRYLVLLEESASHPIAQAILSMASNEGITIPKDMVVEKHTILNGEGICGVVNGLEVYIGNERLFERLGLLESVDPIEIDTIKQWKSLGGTVGLMSIEGHGIVCSFCAADGIRPESAGVIRSLRRYGISVTMLTGDNENAAAVIGRQVGLNDSEIMAKLLPEEKLGFVKNLVDGTPMHHGAVSNAEGQVTLAEEDPLLQPCRSDARSNRSVLLNPFQRRSLIMMCGDGINDTPALVAADVGVAMGAGAAMAMEFADVTLLDSNLEKIEFSVRLGQRVTAKIVENVIFSLVVKFIVLGFALAGMTHLWAAIGSDVGAMLVVTLNAMTLLPKNKDQADREIPRAEVLVGDVEEGKDRMLSSVKGNGPSEVSSGNKVRTNGDESIKTHNSCVRGCCSNAVQ